ncbi:helix-turn-helix domain-containing protein [Paroceanicella profunda]|uniref:Helix-turn-helix domain-containing protein n=1 Tax=Paroceanicella profunda TaxID=2579971 RepID=A0A5B8FUX7_9RHOB|nr:helix-turn-helix transcriptional regulator [Paroceanicella profunda]QDL91114.1 helix-turn-helix domain-containing protein [Paroceanicella profunda]
MDEAPRFLTTAEVATLLRVRERKVYDLAAAGGIPCRRLTGKLLFPREEIELWLEGTAPGPLPEIVAGSHDPLLEWALRESACGLATAFDGSLDGLERLAAREAALAGCHVFEPETGDWNLGHVAARLGQAPVVVAEWARRQQGVLLAPGLGAQVRSLADLAGRRVVRRQPSSGAGMLLDHLIAEAGGGAPAFTPDLARTETEAATAVLSGAAEAAPGLGALAAQFRLDFLPTAVERFDLVVDRRCWFEPPFQRLLAFCRSPGFAARAESFGGYDVSGLGTIRHNGP